MKLSNRIAGCFLIVAGAAMAQDPPSRVARLNYTSGAVSFQPATVADWTEATLNYPMTSGDHLYTDDNALAEMRIGSTAIRLASRTNFEFFNLDDRTVQISITSGAVNIRLRSLREDEVYEIDTPNGAVTLLRSGEYRVDTDPDRNGTMVTVRAGDAEVTANGSSFPIHARQTGYFSQENGGGDIRDANPQDRFDAFASQRDRREDLAPPPRYVSRDLVGYEDLDANGSWIQNAEYGPVWRPRVDSGWAPYRDGRWAWVEPWGWTWIDNAPWGFAPFHYGRWAYIDNGWGWCPGPLAVRPVYAPALVAFIGGSRFSLALNFGGGGGVGWFPLGPREVYQPSYHVSPAYVNRVNVTNITNVTNVNVTNINVNNVRYVNQNVPGAVSAVSRQNFVDSRYVRQSAVSVLPAAVSQAQVLPMAQVAPQQQSVLLVRPADSRNMQIARPPAQVANRQVFVRSTPPPQAVTFAVKQQALASNPGQPVAPAQIQSLRQSAPPTPRVFVRSAMQPAQAGPANVPFTRQNSPVPPPVQQQRQIDRTFPAQRQAPTPMPPIARPNPDAERIHQQQEQQQQQIQRERQQRERQIQQQPRQQAPPPPPAKPEKPKDERPKDDKHTDR